MAVFNPNVSAATVRIAYRHENGNTYTQDVGIPALGRVVVGTPSWVPTGGFGLKVVSLYGHWITAERMVYAGPSWAIGHASPGTPTGSLQWRFAEGSAAAGLFETYVLLTNMAGTSATTTLTYRTAGGAVIGTDTLVIPAYGRGTVWANGTAGPQDFTTEVTSTQPIVAERAMYWPTGSSLLAGLEEPASEAADTALEFLAPVGPTPYTLTEGTPGPTTLGTEGDREVVIGKKSPSSGRGPIGAASEPGTSTSSSGPPWYGSHLSVGRRP